MKQALEGIRVVDLSWVVSGPFCGALLADMGADVIKVEGPAPAFDQSRIADEVTMVDGTSTLFVSLNRGKRGLNLNLKTEKGKRLCRQLVSVSDVLLENYRPGVMERLGLSYPALRQTNLGLIYASITGFGEGSPYEDMPAYDMIAQAMSGMMSATGFPGGPPTKTAGYIADYSAGLYTALAVVAALHARGASGEGQHIEVSMLDSVFTLLGVPLYIYLATGRVVGRIGNADQSVYPFDLFHAKDGYFALAAYDPGNFRRFCAAIGRPDLISEDGSSGFAIGWERREELRGVIERWATDRGVDEILALFRSEGVPAGPVFDIEEIAESEHIRARQMLVPVEDPSAGRLRVPAFPIKMSETPLQVHGSAPSHGEHSEEILREVLHISESEIAQLKAEGVV